MEQIPPRAFPLLGIAVLQTFLLLFLHCPVVRQALCDAADIEEQRFEVCIAGVYPFLERFPGQIVVGVDARDGVVVTEGWLKESGKALRISQGLCEMRLSRRKWIFAP